MGVNIGLGSAEHPDRGYQLFLTALVMVIVAGLVVLGRLAARWANKGYGYDDYAIMVSLVRSLTGYTITSIVAHEHDADFLNRSHRHDKPWYVPPKHSIPPNG